MIPFIAGAGSGAKSCARCLVPATTNGRISRTPPPPLYLQFHPSKPSVNKSQISIFGSRYSTFQERKAIVPSAALWKVPRREGSNSSSERKVAVVAWSVVTLVMAVANRVLQKLALVPMKGYPFFLAQLNSFAYVLTSNYKLPRSMRARLVWLTI